MKIYIIDENKEKINKAKEYIQWENVEFVCDNFSKFIKNTKIDCVVSPGNSFGIMDGGYDLALLDYLGKDMQKQVHHYINKKYYGEQPVGTSFYLQVKEGMGLIHTPTMHVPKLISDPTIVYQCMRSTLICAKENNINSILIPLFGGGTGGVPVSVIAKMMNFAYYQIKTPVTDIDWKKVDYIDRILSVCAINT